MKLVRIVTADETVEFESANVTVRHKPEGVSITPRHTHENTLGFLTLFFPWSEVRQIKEYEKK